MKRPSIFLPAALLALAFSITGCTHTRHSGSDRRAPALCRLTYDNGNPIPANFTGKTGITRRSHAANRVNEIRNVQVVCCEGFDRLVFRVGGVRQPTYTIKYSNPPFADCGSGLPHNVPGNAWMTIHMTPAQGHGAGQATLPRERSFRCRNLRHLSITCDFEAVLHFVVGLNAKRPYRVIELQNPTRLVVDVKH